MPDGDGTDLVEKFAEKLAEQVPIKEVYKDGVAPATQEAGKLLLDTVKTLRLVLFPLQAGAYVNDRLGRFIDRVKAPLPPEQLVLPPPQILGPVLEGIRYEPEGSISDDAFAELLRRAFDRERMGQAHPAFPAMIRALADDEFELLKRVRRGPIQLTFARMAGSEDVKDEDPTTFDREFSFLTYPRQVLAYATHLEALGIFGTMIGTQGEWAPDEHGVNRHRIYWELKLSDFGILFASAVLPEASGST